MGNGGETGTAIKLVQPCTWLTWASEVDETSDEGVARVSVGTFGVVESSSRFDFGSDQNDDHHFVKMIHAFLDVPASLFRRISEETLSAQMHQGGLHSKRVEMVGEESDCEG